LKGPVYGAYSELYAAFSPDLKAEHNGAYITAWGRLAQLPEDLSNAIRKTEDGGSGAADKFCTYCERETSRFM
jgi:retinol dehydrogenase-12